MSGFLRKPGTVTVVVDGFHVVMKDRLVHKDTNAAQRATLHATKDSFDEDGKFTGILDIQGGQDALLASAIVSWDFTDDAGKVLPYATLEEKIDVIEQMDKECLDILSDHLPKPTPARTKEEQAQFRGTVVDVAGEPVKPAAK